MMWIVAVVLMFAGSSLAQNKTPPAAGKMSPKQQLTDAKRMMTEMKQTLSDGFTMLQEARESQDVSRLNSLNEALSAIKGLLRLSEQNFILLQEAVAKGDKTKAEHEYVKISIAYNKIRELDARLRSHMGTAEGGEVDGKPIIDTIKDKDLPIENPSDSLDDIDVDVGRPPSASPFLPKA